MTLSARPDRKITIFHKLWFRNLLRIAAVVMLLVCGSGIYVNAANGVPMYIDFLTIIASPKSDIEGGSLLRPFMYAPVLDKIMYIFPPGQSDPLHLTKNLNPPVVSGMLYPLAFLSLRGGYYTLCFGQLLLGILVLWRVLRLVLPPPTMPLVLATFMMSAYFPVSANMLLGQIGVLPFIFLGAGWLCLEAGQQRRAGVLLGIALVIKMFVGLLFVWLLLRKRWLVLLYGSLTWALLMLLGFFWFGADNTLDWLRALHNVDWGTQTWNASIYGLVSRYFGGTVQPSLLDWPWARWAIRSTALVLSTGALLWLSRQAPRLGETRALNLGFALCLPLMLLLTPLGWIYYFPLLLLTAALLWRESAVLVSGGSIKAGLALALACSSVPQLMSGTNQERPDLWREFPYDLSYTPSAGELIPHYEQSFSWFVLPDIYTLALILLSIVAVRLAYRLRSTQTGA